MIFKRLEIEFEDDRLSFFVFLGGLFIESLPCFIAEMVFPDQMRQKRRNLKFLNFFVVGTVFSEILHDLDRGIQSYQISEPERARFGSADGRTSQFIHLVKVETQFPGQFKYLGHRCHPDPITYESRSILTPDGFFSQKGVTKLHEKVYDVWICVGGRYDFK